MILCPTDKVKGIKSVCFVCVCVDLTDFMGLYETSG